MGQLCSKRKRKLSDQVSFPPPSLSLDFAQDEEGEEPDSVVSQKYMKILKDNGIEINRDIVIDFFSNSDREDILNLLFHHAEVFSEDIESIFASCNGEIDLKRIQFPIFFDFLEMGGGIKFFPQPASGVFSSFKIPRPRLIGWYINQALVSTDPHAHKGKLGIAHARGVVAIATRLLLGQKPKGDLNSEFFRSDVFSAYSESVTLLVFVYALLNVATETSRSLRDLLSCTGDGFIHVILFSCSKCLSDYSMMHFATKSAGFSDLIEQIAFEFPNMPATLFREVSQQSLPDLVYLYFSSRLKPPREQLWFQALREVADLFPVQEDREEFVLMVCEQCHYGGAAVLKELHRVREFTREEKLSKKIQFLEVFCDFFKLYRFTLNEFSKQCTFERKECLFTSLVVSGIKQWKLPGVPLKAAEDWWAKFEVTVKEVSAWLDLPLVFAASKVCSQLLYLVVQAKLGTLRLHVPLEYILPSLRSFLHLLKEEDHLVHGIIRSLLLCSDVTKSDNQKLLPVIKVFSDIGIPERYYSHEKHILEIYSSVLSLLMSVVSSKSGASSQLINMIQSSLSDKDKKKRRELMAASVTCSDFILLSNFVYFESLVMHDTKKLFQHIFNFNLFAFLEFDKVYRLCHLMGVPQSQNPTWTLILHFACIAYLFVKDKDSSVSIIHKLAFEYKYPDTWRLVLAHQAQFGSSLHDIINAALALCPEEQLNNMLTLACPEPKQSSRRNPDLDFLKEFPNLSDSVAVEHFITKLGNDDLSLSFEYADLMANLNFENRSASGTDETAAILHNIASIGCF